MFNRFQPAVVKPLYGRRKSKQTKNTSPTKKKQNKTKQTNKQKKKKKPKQNWLVICNDKFVPKSKLFFVVSLWGKDLGLLNYLPL